MQKQFEPVAGWTMGMQSDVFFFESGLGEHDSTWVIVRLHNAQNALDTLKH